MKAEILSVMKYFSLPYCGIIADENNGLLKSQFIMILKGLT